MSFIIFTGLDKILLPVEDYDCEPVVTAIAKLQQQNIPTIPVTNNTRAEVEALSGVLGFKSALVVEQGSGIFIPQDNQDFARGETEAIDNYYLYQLGCTYTEARAALKVVQEEISKILRGFGDLDEKNIQTMMGVSSPAARRAKSREFSEYFLTPSRLEISQLQEVAAEYGFKILPEGKLSLVLGGNADRGKAVAWLKENYQVSDSVKTIAIGCTAQDLPLLEAVDTPIVIPTEEGIDPIFQDKGWSITSNKGFQGWLEATSQFIK